MKKKYLILIAALGAVVATSFSCNLAYALTMKNADSVGFNIRTKSTDKYYLKDLDGDMKSQLSLNGNNYTINASLTEHHDYVIVDKDDKEVGNFDTSLSFHYDNNDSSFRCFYNGNYSFSMSKDNWKISVNECSYTVVICTNSVNWSQMKCHMWGGNGTNTDWPGRDMVYWTQNDYNQGLFYVAFAIDAHENVIFNNNSGNQTVDITLPLENGHTKQYYRYYINGGSGNLSVGNW